MRPLYRVWLKFSGWLGVMMLWLFFAQGAVCWEQPVIIWLVFICLFLITEKLRYPAGALPFVCLLVLVGWLFLFRLDPKWAGQHFWGVLIGAVFYLIGLFGSWAEYDFPLLFAAAALALLSAAALFGQRIGGAKAWLAVGGMRFQPVEFARILLVFYLGSELSERGLSAGLFGVLAVFFLLLAWQRDLGPALLVFVVFCCLSLVVNFSWAALAAYLGVAAVGFGTALVYFPHLRTRVLAWLAPWGYLESKGYQILQGLFALRAGGAVGRGLGAGSAAVIPAAHTDYLLAVIGEDWGLLGTFSIILVYLALAFWGFRLLFGVEERRQKLIGLGLVLLVHCQVFLVVGGVLRLLPFTGMTLPFLSYGSNSLTAQFWLLGLLAALGKEGA